MNFSVYLTIDPSWLTCPALFVFWVGFATLIALVKLVATSIYDNWLLWLKEKRGK